METKDYHLTMIYKPKYVIKDFQGRHTNNREEVKFDVGVFDNFQDLVDVCSQIDHTNAYIPRNISGKFGYWGTSFDKRTPVPRDSMKMVTKEQALHLMKNGPVVEETMDDDYEEMDVWEREARENEIARREQEEEEYEEFVADLEFKMRNGESYSWA